MRDELGNKKIEFFICGSRGSRPVFGDAYREYGGETSCYIMRCEDYAMVIDCGTGFYHATDVLKNCTKIDIVFTHLHYDHILGALATNILPVDATVRLIGDYRKWPRPEDFFRPPYWPYVPKFENVLSIEDVGIPVELLDGGTVSYYPIDHPNEAYALCINYRGRRICTMVDCERGSTLPEEVMVDADLMLYDAMFDDDMYESVKGWGHSTWQEGCRLMKRFEPKLMLLTHHNPENNDDAVRTYEAKAKQICPEIKFVRTGDVYVF